VRGLVMGLGAIGLLAWPSHERVGGPQEVDERVKALQELDDRLRRIQATQERLQEERDQLEHDLEVHKRNKPKRAALRERLSEVEQEMRENQAAQQALAGNKRARSRWDFRDTSDPLEGL
jgi:seryl-tRNA synthetase